MYVRFEAVRYGEIPRDTADTAGNSYRYVQILLDPVGYRGMQWICCIMARYRSIQEYTKRVNPMRYRIQAGYRFNTRAMYNKYTPGEG